MKGDIQRLFREYGQLYIRANRQRLTFRHMKVIRDITRCSTPEAGWIRFECPDCATPYYIERSCGNRMCPSCQSAKTQQWLGKRLKEQLPIHYFMITFTVPEELNPFFIHRPKESFTAFFKAASEALKTLAGNPRFLGVDLPGFFGVLHTWGRTLNFHPHVHFVVPGGGIDRKTGLWRCSREQFYAPGQALAKVFRGIFRQRIREEKLHAVINPEVWRKNWVVDCQAVGRNSEGVLKYLAPYVFKTAITDSRIVAIKNRSVTFTYKKSGSNRLRKMTIDANEFIRRFLMHVLPAGFMRIRYYGFMGSGCPIPHEELEALVRMAQGFEVEPIEYIPEPKKPLRCPKCGVPMVATTIFTADRRVIAIVRRCRPKRE